MREKKLMVWAIVGLLLAACGEPEGSSPTSLPSESTSTSISDTTAPTTETTMPDVPTSNPDTAPEAVVEKAILDLVGRTNVTADSVTVIAAQEMTWPDGSLGCPQPGMSYTQALVDGSRVLLEAEGRLYAYHAGPDGEPFLCPSGEKDGGYEFVPPPGFDQ
jgi:hypothetical protein